jgi:hypothetical protein
VEALATTWLRQDGEQRGVQRLDPVQQRVHVLVKVEVAGAQGGHGVDQGNRRDVAH